MPPAFAPVLKVLVVGPESLSGVLGPTVLGRPDIDRVHVESADGAVEAAERARPHMVVIDLPRAEAVAVVRGLRQNEVTRPTAIVWLNRTDPPDAETELAVAGANAAIPLPVDPFLWDRRLEELLSVPARRTERFPVRLSDWSRFVSGADEDEGSVINIGARGALLESPRELELGTKVGLTFDLPGQGPVPSSVVNIGARGVLLESPRELELGTKVGLTFDLPGSDSPVARGGPGRAAGRGRGGALPRGNRVPRLPWRRPRADRRVRGGRAPRPTAPAPRPPSFPSPCARSRRRASGRKSCGRARSARRSSSTPPSTAS